MCGRCRNEMAPKRKLSRKPAKRQQRMIYGQVGGVSPGLIVGIGKAGYGITKALGDHQTKRSIKIAEKRRREVEQGKRKRYARESFNWSSVPLFYSKGMIMNRGKRKRQRQRWGILPVFLIPAVIAAAKAAATGPSAALRDTARKKPSKRLRRRNGWEKSVQRNGRPINDEFSGCYAEQVRLHWLL